MLLAERFAPRKQLYLDYLTSRGVENRPIVSGNFARQPALRLLGVDLDPAGFPGAERVGRCGFFIGLHTEPIEASDIAMLADILLGYELD
jgi:CDP-6-deoxy-D-xylo-4-hexulose-3-dehydrase